jgi:hypothetical protein
MDRTYPDEFKQVSCGKPATSIPAMAHFDVRGAAQPEESKTEDLIIMLSG